MIMVFWHPFDGNEMTHAKFMFTQHSKAEQDNLRYAIAASAGKVSTEL